MHVSTSQGWKKVKAQSSQLLQITQGVGKICNANESKKIFFSSNKIFCLKSIEHHPLNIYIEFQLIWVVTTYFFHFFLFWSIGVTNFWVFIARRHIFVSSQIPIPVLEYMPGMKFQRCTLIFHWLFTEMGCGLHVRNLCVTHMWRR